jgi:bifunctional enzyme CysN/CysC
LTARLSWFDEQPLFRGRSYLMQIGPRLVTATVSKIAGRLDVDTLNEEPAGELKFNEIGRVSVALSQPIPFEPYRMNHEMGGFILIDRITRNTVAAGLIEGADRIASDVHWHKQAVDKTIRGALKGQRPAVLWFTGLSGAGKSTIANLTEARLAVLGRHTIILDGDNVRHGLNRDLGFSEADRVENIRRVAEVARLFVEAGLIVLVSFISPYRAERTLARERVEAGEFIEVFVDTPVEECARRDPKGLYAKAMAGEIRNFTGVDAPYEAPQSPEIHLSTVGTTPEDLADRVVAELRGRSVII